MKLLDRIIYELGWGIIFFLFSIAAGVIVLPVVWGLFLKPFYDFFVQAL